jgi:hypothetical protein
MPTLLDFAGLDDLLVEAVDRRQHFAEKLHALTRDYGDRPNTRVKDLPDLLTLIERGLEPDEEPLAAAESLRDAAYAPASKRSARPARELADRIRAVRDRGRPRCID